MAEDVHAPGMDPVTLETERLLLRPFQGTARTRVLHRGLVHGAPHDWWVGGLLKP